MNFLHRVLYGRVAKSRPAPTEQHLGNTYKATSRSPTQSRQVRDPSPCAGSDIIAPSFAGLQSAHHGQPLHSGATLIPQIRIKHEDEDNAFTMAPAVGDDLDSTAKKGPADEVMAAGDDLNEDESLESSIEEGSSGGDSFEEGSEDIDEEQLDENDAVEEELIATSPALLNSDEPIPSIEEDDSNIEKDEQPQLRKKHPPFLHEVTHRRVPGSNLEDGVDGVLGMKDEEFEEELGGEIEENLLIDDNDLRCWLHHKRSTAGIENWPTEACRVYKLLFLRGLYPMFDSQWTWNFLDHPMPGKLFTPLGSGDKCFLKAKMSDYHASKALIRLFNLHGYVSDYRQCSIQEKIAPLIEKEIKRYVLWAEKDGDFVKKRNYVSPVFVITCKDAQAASTGQPVVERCQSLVNEYRARYAAQDIQDYPRCVYVFVVVQHIVLVMVADTEHPDEEPYPLAELDLSQKGHWLDCALGIAITVTLARDALLAHRRAFPKMEVVEDDPDL